MCIGYMQIAILYKGLEHPFGGDGVVLDPIPTQAEDICTQFPGLRLLGWLRVGEWQVRS